MMEFINLLLRKKNLFKLTGFSLGRLNPFLIFLDNYLVVSKIIRIFVA